MKHSAITSVITEGGLTRYITATATIAPGNFDVSVRGVTELAAHEIRSLIMAAAKRYGLRLPRKAVTVELAFDVPFERTSELGFAAFMSLVFASGIMEAKLMI